MADHPDQPAGNDKCGGRVAPRQLSRSVVDAGEQGDGNGVEIGVSFELKVVSGTERASGRA